MGNKIKEKRKLLNLSVYAVARKTGLTPGYISNLENENRTNPSRQAMDKIATALDSTIEDLFY